MNVESRPSDESPPLSLLIRVDAACRRFEAAWKAGVDPVIEDFLADWDEPGRSELALELVLLEIHYRRGRGQACAADDFLERFPTLDRAALTDDAAPTTETVAIPPAEGPAVAAPWRSFGDYELVEEISRGGMGVVYKARQKSLNRLVALKVILTGEFAGPQELARFRREARAIAQLQHPNIVQVHEIGEHEGRPFFSLEFCPGGSLDKKLNGTPLPPGEAARLVEVLARAVHYAHQQNVVHRDLKPANVLLSADGTAKVADFGLAKMGAAQSPEEIGATQSGAVVGTPSYMAPEQAAGKQKEIGPAADVYALGAILYECLTGRPPFKAATPLDTLMQVLTNVPVSPRQLQSKTPRDVETICLQCLEKQPARRYSTALALAEDLHRFLVGEAVRARPVGTVERAAKWARRRPTLAAAYGLLLAALVLGAGGGAAMWLWLGAEKARGEAETAKGAAEIAQTRAEKAEGEAKQARDDLKEANRKLTQYSYADRVYLASLEWDAGQVTHARSLLDEAGCFQEELTPGRHSWEWDYLSRALHPELAVLEGEGHTGLSSSVSFSPDGGRLASAGGPDGTVHLWDVFSGKPLAVLEGHTRFVSFSPDGARLACGSGDGTVRLLDAASGKPLAVLVGHTSFVSSAAFSPDGGRLASVGGDGTVRLWDAVCSKPLAVLVGHSGPSWSVAFSPDGSCLASGGQDGTIRLWNAASGKPLAVLKGHTLGVTSVSFSPDGARLASASGQDGTVRLWDGASGKQLAVLVGDPCPSWSVAFSPDGDCLASGGQAGIVRLWDAASGKPLAVLKGHTGVVRSVSFSPDGGRLATGSGEDGTVRLWDAACSKPLAALQGHTKAVYSVAFSPDGSRLVSASGDGTVRLWDAASGKQLAVLEGHTGGVTSASFSPDGARLVSASVDGTARLWDAASGKQLAVLDGRTLALFFASFSPDGGRLASAGVDGTVRLWNAASGKQLAVLEGHTSFVSSVVFSPDGGRLASSSLDGTVRLWDAASGKSLVVLKGHMLAVFSVAFSPNGGRLASAGVDGTVRLWDAASGKPLAVLEGHKGGIGSGVKSVSFSPDGERLASAGVDGTVRLWDVASGKPLAVLTAQTGGVNSVAFSPDGGRLASAGFDGTVRLWIANENPENQDKRRRLCREQQAAEAEKDGHWFAAAFHLGRMIREQPDAAALYARRAKAYALQGKWMNTAADLLQGGSLRQSADDPPFP